MRGKRATLGAIAAVALAFPVAGCGDDDDPTTTDVTSSSTTSTTAVATDEFITAADARCAEANAAIANLTGDGSGSSTVLEQQRDITKQTLSGLKSLGSPDDPDGSLDDYYDAVKEQVALLGQQQSALASGDSAGADALTTQLDQAEGDAQSAAESFGFEECGQTGTTLSTDGSTTNPSSGATTTTPVAPTTTPVTPATTTPVTPPPSTGGGTSGGTNSGGTSSGSSGGSGSGGSSGGISPGG